MYLQKKRAFLQVAIVIMPMDTSGQFRDSDGKTAGISDGVRPGTQRRPSVRPSAAEGTTIRSSIDRVLSRFAVLPVEDPSVFSKSPRCQILTLPGNQVAIGVDGRERIRWHAGQDSPRPFFFPLIGPSGLSLTRMGHPGAPNHDHHRSIWFAHHKVLGIDFWSDSSEAVIRQQQWLAYEDGEDEARMAVRLHWYDGHDPQPLIKQELIAAVSPDPDDGLFVEIQTSLSPTSESLELSQTNFGLLAVRVAKPISAVFGDGILTGANGQQTESNLFGKSSPWMDYSGSISPGTVEGITYYDHPANAGFPSKWHVRDDGWMGASICRDGNLILANESPTTFRYLLHAHRDHVVLADANRIAAEFHHRKGMVVGASDRPHRAAEIRRET